jgi:hypothetical protein
MPRNPFPTSISTASMDALEAILAPKGSGSKSGHSGGRSRKPARHEPGTERIRGFRMGRTEAPFRTSAPEG